MRIKFLAILMCGLLSAAAIGQKPEATINKASVAPVVDGQIDAVWTEANSYNISKAFSEETPSLGAEGETTWKALWMDHGIYVLVQVNDNAFFPKWADSPEGQADYLYDLPELFFDINTTLEDGLGVKDGLGHHLVSPGFREGEIDGTSFYDNRNPEVLFAHRVLDPTYVSEYYIPFSTLTDREGNPISNNQIGFDVYIRDRDPGDFSPHRAVWANTGNIGEPWINMDDCGTMTLEGAEPVSDITLAEGVINQDNGTLQMEAMIYPANAFNKKLKWTVSNGTGKASINDMGLVTAIADGIVTVTAIAIYGSGIEASAVVTISNQVPEIEELNLIRNGNFDRIDEAGFPEEWIQLLAIQDRTPFVEDGHVVLDPAQDLQSFYEYQFVQEEFGCNTTSEYMFSFVAWADEARTFQVHFEDPVNQWNLYGVSDHDDSFMGQSGWIFDVSTVPTHYSFYVIFKNKLETTRESLVFQLGLSGIVCYLDSVQLINLDDLPLLRYFNPITSLTISSEGDAVTLLKDQNLQMSADVLPLDATLADYRWSVLPGSGNGTIDKHGLLTGTEAGTLTVVATGRDGSNFTGEMEIEVIQLVNSIKVTGELGATSLERKSTMQMSAELEPEDASVKEINWSIAQGTGEASIDENGLLTSLETGTVIVMAFATDESGVSGAMEVKVIAGVGIEPSGVHLLTIYPNPAIDELKVSHAISNSTLSIFNSKGVLMEEVEVIGTIHQFNIETYPPGVYFVKNRKQVVKFVK
jgi:hypothetical protein